MAKKPRDDREHVVPKAWLQRTQPKGKDKDGEPYEPVEIPVVSRAEVLEALEKVSKPHRKP